MRDGHTIVARTTLGRAERVVIGGHLDTVPENANMPSRRVTVDGEDRLYGLGACDMKGGVAVSLRLAADLVRPTRDVTWIYYEAEEIDSEFNGLRRLADERPELLAADFAVLMEPSNAVVEAGCQGTMRVEVRTTGTRAHSARSWMGHNAIHDAGEVLRRLSAYEPRTVEIDGLTYREGLNAVAIRGGVAGNVIPDECVVSVNYRFAPSRSAVEGEAHLREVFEGYDVTRGRRRRRCAARPLPPRGRGVRRRGRRHARARSSAGPTSRASPRSVCRRSTSARATRRSRTTRTSTSRSRTCARSRRGCARG